jgi:pimeloyl-ACP methyl ester carboxylesterase
VIALVVLALACVAVPAWVLGTRWSTVVTGHPAYLLLLLALVVTGLVVGLRARRERRPGRLRLLGRAGAAVVLVLVLAVTAWLRPFPATDPSTGSVQVVSTVSTWEIRPEGTPDGVGVVFYPGARVDPRAYLALLRPVAAAGHLVIVVKPPLDIAFLAGGPGAVFDAHPEVVRWIVGGHSLGGTAAAAYTDDPHETPPCEDADRPGADGRVGDERRRGSCVAGLVLWASYPAGDLSRTGVPVLSVSGDRDGLATPADIDAARPLLPSATEYVVVEGGVHAYFGDYGPQPGDGVAGVDRAVAPRQIVDATLAFLAAR